MTERRPDTIMNRLIFMTIIVWSGITQHTLAESQTSFATTIDTTKTATVAILPDTQEGTRPATSSHFSIKGTGFHLRDGYIITARHAVERQQGSQTTIAKTIHVLTHDLREIPATFVGFNEVLDIAIYRLAPNKSPLPATRFAAEEARPGDEVYTVGYPLGWGPAMGFGTMGNPSTFLPTVASRLHQIDLSTCSGNSGGGLFNQRGEIVGVIHAIIQTETTEADRRCSRFAFAIPGRLVERIINSLIQGHAIRFSSLGIRLTTIQDDQQWKVAVAKATGPAKTGGVQKGDILLSIDNQPIHTSAELKTYLIEQTIPGQRIELEIQRGQERHHLPITLGGF